jgi:hypothetical protein
VFFSAPRNKGERGESRTSLALLQVAMAQATTIPVVSLRSTIG